MASATIQKKQAYHHGDLPRALKQAAIELIDEKGISGFTIREAARRAGVTHTAPYRHFRDRSALVAALAVDGFIKLRSYIRKDVQAVGDDPVAGFLAAGGAYVRFALGNRAYFHAMYGPDTPVREDFSELADADEAAFAELRRTVVAGQKAGLIVEGDPDLLALVAWSTVHGVVHVILEGGLERRGIAAGDMPAMFEHGQRLLLGGFLRR